MPALDLTAYKPAAGGALDAVQIDNGFQAIVNTINALDAANFAAGKIFDPAKLLQDAAVDGDALVWDNTNSKWVPASAMPATSQRPGLVKFWDSVDAGVTLPAASVSTPTLPTTFKHLLVEFVVENSSGAQNFFMRINGDVGANYFFESLLANAGAVSSAPSAGANGYLLGLSGPAEPLAGTCKLLSFRDTTFTSKNIVSQAYCQNDGAGSQKLYLHGGMWNNPVAVTSLSFSHAAGNIVAGSRITVYVEV